MSWFFQPIPAATTGPNQAVALDVAVVGIVAPDLAATTAVSATLDVATLGIAAPDVAVTSAIAVAIDVAIVGITAPDVAVAAAIAVTLDVATLGIYAPDLTALYDQAAAMDIATLGLIALDVTAELGDVDPEPEPEPEAAALALDGVVPIVAVELLRAGHAAAALSHAPALTCALSHGFLVAATTEHVGVLSITVRHTNLEGLMADTYVTTTRVRVYANFTNLAGRAFDPKVLDVTIKTPSGRSTYRQGRDAQIGRTGVGNYYVDVLASAAGSYRTVFASTAAGEERAIVDEFSAITAEQALSS